MSITSRDCKGKIMLVEDNQNLRSVLKEYFEALRYTVDDFGNGAIAKQEYAPYKYDICILDIIMQGIDGFDLLQEIRQKDQEVPVIFLTARTDKEDRIKAFKLGCDDYITKPFCTEELILRIEAILRRTRRSRKSPSSMVSDSYDAAGGLAARLSGQEGPTLFHIGNYVFDYSCLQLTHPLKTRNLTRKEAELLRLLCENVNKLMPRDVILRQIWGSADYANGRSMDVFLTKLRSYLSLDPVDEKYLNKDPKSKNKYVDGFEPNVEIRNIHGTGFILKVKE